MKWLKPDDRREGGSYLPPRPASGKFYFSR